MPEEVIESLQEEIMIQKERGNEKFGVELFAPRYSENSWWESEYTYKTHKLKKYITKMTDASIPSIICEGRDAYDFAESAENLVISVAGN